MNAFEILGIESRLVLADEFIRDLFREAGKEAHPDAGGGEGEFAALREAFAIVSSPSRRLRHWLELRGTPPDIRGSIGSSLMDFFSEVGAVTQQAEVCIRKREQAKSVLVRAMLEGETQVCREAVEKTITEIELLISAECGFFPQWEASLEVEIGLASRVVRNLAFLEKWRAGLRGCYARLA